MLQAQVSDGLGPAPAVPATSATRGSGEGREDGGWMHGPRKASGPSF